MNHDVFISYSRKDTAIADRICAAFDRAGISYFIDRQGIAGGMEFPQILADAIECSQLFLFLASGNSYQSKYTNNEVTFAFNEKPHNTLLPYVIDGSRMPSQLRFTFASINVRDMREHPIEPVLVEDVLQLLGRDNRTREEEARKKQEEAERRAKEEAERKAKAEEERKRREEAERRAKEEAERKAREEAARKAKAEEERKKQEEEEQKYIVVGTGRRVVDILKNSPKGATHIRIADGVEEICGSYSSNLSKNRSIVSVFIPNSVKRIGEQTFRDCSGLTSINIPNSVTAISSRAFEDCSGLTSINIPNSVTAIGIGAFIGCTGLTSITVDPGNTHYDSRNNCNAIIETASNSLIAGCKNTVIPNSVTVIGSWAFFGCSSLTSINIPNSVTAIYGYAFRGCSGLTTINIPNSVTDIEWHAFEGCSGLTTINIPNSVTAIGIGAFTGCTGLTSLNIPSSVEEIGACAFSGCDRLERASINAGTRYVKNIFKNTDENTFPKHTKITKRWRG